MNTRFFPFLLLFILFAVPGTTFSQLTGQAGLPYTQTLQPQKFGVRNENVSIVQGSKGLIYLGTSNGIVQYDGRHWERVASVPNPLLVKGDQTVYAAQHKDFGYLVSTSKTTCFQSLLDSSFSPAEINGLAKAGRNIYFSAGNTLYSFHKDTASTEPAPVVSPSSSRGARPAPTKEGENREQPIKASEGSQRGRKADRKKASSYRGDDKTRGNITTSHTSSGHTSSDPITSGHIRKVKTFTSRVKVFSGNHQRLYLHVRGKGLFVRTRKEFTQCIPPQRLTSPPVKVVKHRGQMLAFLEEGKVLKIPGAGEPLSQDVTFHNLKLPFRNPSVTDVTTLRGRLVVATRSNGLVLYGANDQPVQLMNENRGLLHTRINKLFVDNTHQIWALHPNGISIVQPSSGIRIFGRHHGIEGTINQVTRYQNSLYLATSKGVYRLPGGVAGTSAETMKFQKIAPLTSEAFNFYTTDSLLFVTTRQGIFKIGQGRAKLYYNKFSRHYTAVLQYDHQPQYLLIGMEDGLSVVRYQNGLFIHQGKARAIEGHILDICEDQHGNVWINTRYNGLYRIRHFPAFNNQLYTVHYNLREAFSKNTEWVKPYALSDGLLFSTSDGLFRFNPSKNRFYRDSLPGLHAGDQIIHPVAEAQDHTLWISSTGRAPGRKQVLYALPDSAQGTIPQFNLSLSTASPFQIHAIHPEGDSLVWIGGNNKLLRLSAKACMKQNHQPRIFIHEVVAGKDSMLLHNHFYDHRQQQVPVVDYGTNLLFTFSAISYGEMSPMLFRTRLVGTNKEWSSWSTLHQQNYPHLREGTYRFEVQAKNAYGMRSPILQHTFKIRPPLYRTWYAYTAYILALAGLVYLLLDWRARYHANEKRKLEEIIDQRTRELQQEKEKSDRLIERMLPKDTAEDLKAGVKTRPYFYNKITVLFGDIQGFTKITEEMGQSTLIDRLSRCFLQFDHIVEKYNIEKIKTIGDAYMCAGGIPEENQIHPIEVILAAMEMQNYMHRVGSSNGNSWNIRIGIDTGPVVAGVIGRNKLSYDIWGSTVNMASRMEALSQPGKINISGNTHALIKDFFICRYRGKMPVKNSGEIDMYFVEGLLPALASDKQGTRPNQSLYTQLQLLRLNDIEEVVLEKLEKLPDSLYYHNLKHTVDVVTQVELIGKAEGVSEEDMLLLKTAALFHDTGHLVSYDHHEEEGARMAREMLPQYHYTHQQIERIAELILATRMPPQPRNLLEKIICDADLDYLGRTDFVPVAYNLYKELKVRNKVNSFEHWKQVQIDFIRNHAYFTETAQRLREVNKKKQLEKIIREMDDKNGKPPSGHRPGHR